MTERPPKYLDKRYWTDETPTTNQSPLWDTNLKKFRPSLPKDFSIASQAQGDIIYFNGTNWVRLAPGTSGQFLQTQGAGANPVWAGASTMKAPFVLSPADVVYSIGGQLSAHAVAAPASGAYPSANRAHYIPFWLPESITLTQFFCHNGTTVAGTNHIDIGVYTSAGAKVVTTGSTVQTGISTTQVIDVADTAIAAGVYYLAIAMDNAADHLFRWLVATVDDAKAWGCAVQATAFPLPATITPASFAGIYIPQVGFTTRSFV